MVLLEAAPKTALEVGGLDATTAVDAAAVAAGGPSANGLRGNASSAARNGARRDGGVIVSGTDVHEPYTEVSELSRGAMGNGEVGTRGRGFRHKSGNRAGWGRGAARWQDWAAAYTCFVPLRPLTYINDLATVNLRTACTA